MATRSEIDALMHSHVFLGSAHDDNARRTRWVVALTAAMMIGEIVAGILYGSMALLADGFHMATHAGALAIAAAAYAFAKRHATSPRFTFGTGKVGDLAGFASALILGVAALGIAAESVFRLLEPRPVGFGPAAAVAVVGLVVNVISALLLSGDHRHGAADAHHHDHGHHGHHGQHHHHDHHDHHDHAPRDGDHGHHRSGAHHGAARRSQDNNLRSAYLHVLADALTSVLALAALLAGRYLDQVWLDPAMGIVGAVIIARWSWTMMRDSAAVLLDVADPELERAVREEVEGRGASITDLHVWRLGPEAHAAIVSVTGPVDAETVRSRLKPIQSLAHVTVECR